MLTNAGKRRFALLVAATAVLGTNSYGQRHSNAADAPSMVVSSDKPFTQMLHDAMATMDRGMRDAPMTGVPEHDFVAMMIPHHQGAIDMAKALLLTTKDPELRNLAQGIVTEQENEIRLMRARLDRNAERRR